MREVNPTFGTIWEGVGLTNLKGHFPEAEIRYYRTCHGSEIDFLVFFPSIFFAVECKASKAPSLSKGTWTAIDDLTPECTFIAAPVEKGFPVKKNVFVVSLDELIGKIAEKL